MTEAHHLIQEVIMGEEENVHALDDDLCDKLHEWYTREMETIMPDILLSDIDKMDDGIFGLIDIDDIDEIMAASAGKSKEIKPEHLSKVWRINLDEAGRTLDVTTQHQTHSVDPKIARNYGTNNRMLRYRRLKTYFYMDTFFATKKAGPSSRGFTCM